MQTSNRFDLAYKCNDLDVFYYARDMLREEQGPGDREFLGYIYKRIQEMEMAKWNL